MREEYEDLSYHKLGEWKEYHTNDIADMKWSAMGTGVLIGMMFGGFLGVASTLIYFWH